MIGSAAQRETPLARARRPKIDPKGKHLLARLNGLGGSWTSKPIALRVLANPLDLRPCSVAGDIRAQSGDDAQTGPIEPVVQSHHWNHVQRKPHLRGLERIDPNKT